MSALMQFASGLSTHRDPDDAVADALAQADLDSLGSAHMAFAFASPAYGPALGRIPQLLAERTGCANVAGCTGGGILASGQEVESAAGVAVLIGHLPDADALIRHVTAADLPCPDAPPDAWARALYLPGDESLTGFLLFTDPFHPTFKRDAVIDKEPV